LIVVVGELINTSRKAIYEAVENGDKEYIQSVAKAQMDAGATYLDVNCGTFMEREKEVMKWLIETIREVTDAPLCIDSPDPEALRIGLELCGPNAMINSTTFETPRFEAVVPLAVEFKAKLIALCISDEGMPDGVDDRADIARRMVQALNERGVKNDDIYLDPLIKPMSAGQMNGKNVLDAIYRIVRENEGVHMICGLSNISYSLPARKQINKTFMIQTMAMGMDGYIIDITNKEMAGALFASQLLLGQDKYCRKYINAYRRGIYGEPK